MIKENTCCFTGPRPPRLPGFGDDSARETAFLRSEIKAAVFEAYYEGYRVFMSGMAEGFDLLAAEAVLELKEEFEGISLAAVLPFSGAPKRHSPETAERIEAILRRADAVFSITENYFQGCELIRNRYMVDRSSLIIGYYDGTSPGTAHCWKYALEKGLETVNLYEKQ